MNPERRPSPIDRLLRLFTDVRPGEAGTALLLTLNVFLLFVAYYVLKTIRESLILGVSGPEAKAYVSAGQTLLLLGAVPLYALLAGKFPRRRLINVVTAFFLACIVGFYALANVGVRIDVAYFLWLGIFNLMVIAQFWSFANDVYTTEEGKRIFPIVAFGASSGSAVGSVLIGQLIGPLGIHAPMLIAGGILLVALAVTNVVDSRERRRTESARPVTESTANVPAATKELRLDSGEFRIADLKREMDAAPSRHGEPKPTPDQGKIGGGGDAFKLVMRNRYLLLIALLMLFLNWVNTTGEYILGRMVTDAARDAVARGAAGGIDKGAFIGKFYADFFGVVNVVGLVLQLFVVSRVIKFAGVRIAIMVLPLIALFGYAVLALVPILGVVRWVKTAENSTDYSLQNTVRNILFLPTTREEKYKAKQAIDSFFVRAGDLLSAGLVLVGTNLLHLATKQFALVNLVLVGVWLILAVQVGRAYKRVEAVAT